MGVVAALILESQENVNRDPDRGKMRAVALSPFLPPYQVLVIPYPELP